MFCVAPFEGWPEQTRSNQQLLNQSARMIAGLSLASYRRLARAEALDAAARYLGEFGQNTPTPSEGPLVVTSHQPELFHNGVWIKAFGASRLAQRLEGCSLNVLIDTDLLSSTVVPIPTGTVGATLLSFTPFDASGPEVPYEERTVLDEKTFSRFGETVAKQLGSLVEKPLIQEFWRRVVHHGKRTDRIGERFAAGRRDLERTMDCANLEVPLSRLCRTNSFGRLAAEMILRAPEVARTHNRLLLEYRRLNHIKSRHHPFPDLAIEKDRVEVPLWCWSGKRPQRKHLVVRTTEDAIELLAESEVVATLPKAGDIGELAEAIAKLKGIKLRPRAILTTLFLRLGLADFFIHGIGGGKYDELTDAFLEEFWGVEPPHFGILSGTNLLPAASQLGPDPRQELSARLRDMTWNPDRFLDDLFLEREPISSWIERKYELMEQSDGTRHERRARYREFRQLNDQLRPFIQSEIDDLKERLDQLSERRQGDEALRSREFPFCLHPRGSIDKLSLALDARLVPAAS
ncbi:hypothetical protein Pan216_41240 [Planctomycetes bacterium Pan216]|uniref:Uncharacterized protein n=1 Tax=Kolteria novifilia TaxID=2527975 RepID=A0A518B8E0_9BACT|nr:hypothetical protein Pan216_41240 [Planctomycetes bacterium Pan216]